MRSRIFWGAILILIGLVLMMDNLGFLRINIWGLIWPLVIIAIGVRIIWNNYFRSDSLEGAQFLSIPLESASGAEIRFDHGAGRLTVGASVNPGNILEGNFGGGVEHSLNRSGSQAQIRLSVQHGNIADFPFAENRRIDWTVRLTRDIPLSLYLHTGASETDLDLTELRVQNLHLETGASSTRITFPSQAGFTRADVHCGAASVDIRIPVGVAARIRVRGGLSSANIDTTRFLRSGDSYESTDYTLAQNKADLDLEVGVGSVSVS